ncbi:uncharacterized protein H6S33_006400 [Morchella sextelata]|uniref:uncharacterized protein n=1 Tax=Morchella sextelata TaxID=1174677 RepID=UPI001D04BE86|nr:uncharacterized protein H6S33_006400 [Morchella sextelata]KAH0604732.1 hypothetical protein H6S33_006400 [Morchella sextelata]
MASPTSTSHPDPKESLAHSTQVRRQRPASGTCWAFVRSNKPPSGIAYHQSAHEANCPLQKFESD